MDVRALSNDFTQIIRNRMGDYRFEHSVNVAKSAVMLALKYGADVEKAELAGILHDSCKEIDKEEMLQIINDSGIMLDVAEENSSKLWHAIAGYCYAKDVLKIEDEDVLNAIRYHTTGRANMSLLERIIFIADFISDERMYNGVEIMREKANSSLEEAMLYGLQFTIGNLAERNLVIHPNALDCYNQVVIHLNNK